MKSRAAAVAGSAPGRPEPGAAPRTRGDSPSGSYEEATRLIEAWVRADLAGWTGSWGAGVRRALEVIADLLEAEPEFARLCGFGAFSAGAEGLARHRALVTRLIPALAAGREERDPDADDLPADLERGLIGGAIFALGEAERPAELVPDLTYYLLTPYLGSIEAGRLAAEE